ncbi:NRDE family protein [Neobacillus sp. CF12]|uniref:NRDE family protein n=1 Tax=Neobacillus sp. CF12 TaxID=3055864 RepID=UPI0025A116B5|nr:NRDE family protein [Neobacillus sp. CF12]MDM5329082.1 NRDE family protein [Neobacillus sp. CF12]
MCLILFAYKVHPKYKLMVAANRDEFYQRPTAPVHYWEDDPEILAGRDLEKLGTWMGVTKTGRFAALTNYRDPKEVTQGKRSRGELVANALQYKGDIKEYMQSLVRNNDTYPGYNLLAGDSDELYYYSNVKKELITVTPGIYGVSNHLLNTTWPKVQTGKEGLAAILDSNQEDLVEPLLTLLQKADQAPDEELPQTGVSLDLERLLSPMFIKSDNYGTRSSTVLLMNEQEIHYVERVFTFNEINTQKYTIEMK